MKNLFPLCLFGSLLFSVTVYSQTPTWSQDIAPIVYQHCTVCHNTGGVAPFPLEHYFTAFTWSANMAADVSVRKMPPWPPIADYKHYCNERVLTQAEIDKIVNWANAGAPEGDEALAPPVPVFNHGPLLGIPDLKLTIPTHTSTATTADEYACFVLPTGLTSDKFVRGIQIEPGNRAIVHHVILSLDTTANLSNCMVGLAGGALTMYSWASGMSPAVFPQWQRFENGNAH